MDLLFCESPMPPVEDRSQVGPRGIAGPAWDIHELPSMNEKRCFAGAVKIDKHRILVIGGADGDKLKSSTELYDSRKQLWKAFPDLNEKRAAFAAVMCSKKIYVFGGRGGRSNRLDSVECMDLTTKPLQWNRLGTKLSSKKSGCAAVAVGSYVYVMGGRTEDSDDLTSVDVLDTTTGYMWQGPPMLSPRFGCGAAAVNNTIYVVGGQDQEENRLRTIESLAVGPSNDLTANKWQRCAAVMSTERFFPAVTVVAGCLVVTGGRDSEERALESAEMIDTKIGARRQLPKMSKARYGSTAVTFGDSRITVLGGSTDEGTHNSVEVLPPDDTILNSAEAESAYTNSNEAVAKRLATLELVMQEMSKLVVEAEQNRQIEFQGLMTKIQDRMLRMERNREQDFQAIMDQVKKRKSYVFMDYDREEHDTRSPKQETKRDETKQRRSSTSSSRRSSVRAPPERDFAEMSLGRYASSEDGDTLD